MVFGRVRLRIDDVEPGATVHATGPYGAISGEADDRGRVFETEDIGATGDFTSPFTSRHRAVPARGRPPRRRATSATGSRSAR